MMSKVDNLYCSSNRAFLYDFIDFMLRADDKLGFHIGIPARIIDAMFAILHSPNEEV